jgi:hypothetical protein
MTTRDDETCSAPTSYWVDLVDQAAESSQFVELNCNLALIERAQKLFHCLDPCVSAVVDVLLELCYSRLDKQIEQELGSLGESVRQLSKLFFKGHDPGEYFYDPTTAVIKLSKLIGAPVGPDDIQLKDRLNYLGACEEMTDRFARLEPIRSRREKLTRHMTSHLPHVSFYDFCRLVVDSGITRDADSLLQWHRQLKRFFTVLDCPMQCSNRQSAVA